MNIGEQLKSRIVKDSKNILLLFASEQNKEYFKRKINPPENYILLSTHNLEHKLVGLRYKEYKYLNQDQIRRFLYRYENELKDSDIK